MTPAALPALLALPVSIQAERSYLRASLERHETEAAAGMERRVTDLHQALE